MARYVPAPDLCLLLVVALACLPPLPRACFIRNCPVGGKRSMDSNVDVGPKQCMACGPDRSGQCVGPDICCGPFGCHIGTVESAVCQQENESTTPCYVPGPSCGARDQGTCAADGICCDAEACSLNAKCRQPPSAAARSSSSSNPGVKTDLLQLLRRLLRARHYD